MELQPFFEISAPECEISEFYIFSRSERIFKDIFMIFGYVILWLYIFNQKEKF